LPISNVFDDVIIKPIPSAHFGKSKFTDASHFYLHHIIVGILGLNRKNDKLILTTWFATQM